MLNGAGEVMRSGLNEVDSCSDSVGTQDCRKCYYVFKYEMENMWTGAATEIQTWRKIINITTLYVTEVVNSGHLLTKSPCSIRRPLHILGCMG